MSISQKDFGSKAKREGASAAAYLCAQGHLGFFAMLPGCPSMNVDRVRPGS
jgi:hypothetical protein